MTEMKDPMEKVAGSRNAIEKLLLQIPGYRGYLKAEYRRETDKLQREYLAQRLAATKKIVDELKCDMVDEGILDGLDRFEGLLDKLDRIVSRITYADYGASGFFDTVKIDDEALETIAQVDMALVRNVEAIEKEMARLREKLDGAAVRKAAREITRVIEEFDAQFDKREHIVTGVI